MVEINLDGGAVDMETVGTGSAATQLQGAADVFGTAWTAARLQISNLDGQLGKGPMGEAFMAGYRDPAFTASMGASGKCYADGSSDGVAGTLGGFAAVCRRAIEEYIAADARGRAALER